MMNETKRQERIREFKAHIDVLYNSVREWLDPTNLVARRDSTHLNEEAVGRYEVPTLIISARGKHIAELRPVGLAIVGAKGRVDLIGTFDSIPLLYLLAGGGAITSTVSAGGKVLESSSRPLFHGVQRSGWYWIEDKQIGVARLLDRFLFQKLLARASDYERR
jgi:hypothetical protein